MFQNAKFPATNEYTKEVNDLDNQLGRAIVSAEKKCRKFHDGQIPYSPVFIKHVINKELWHALIRKYKGLKVSNRRINKLAGKLGIYC